MVEKIGSPAFLTPVPGVCPEIGVILTTPDFIFFVNMWNGLLTTYGIRSIPAVEW